MIKCPYCGEYNGDTRETCFKCGESLNNPQNIEQRKMCTICGEVVRTTAHRCPRCGGLLQRFDGTEAEAEEIRAQKQYEISKPDTQTALLQPAESFEALKRAIKRRSAKEILRHGLLFICAAIIVVGVIALSLWLGGDDEYAWRSWARLLRQILGLFGG